LTTCRGDEIISSHQYVLHEISKPDNALQISIKPLSCFMLSPIAFTSAPFESLIYPKEIYEISIQSLVSFSDQVSLFAYKKVAHQVKPVATTLLEDF